MELSLKSKQIKKRHKKKKICVPDGDSLRMINVKDSDGANNWARMQEIFRPIEIKQLKESAEKKMLSIIGINQDSKDYRHPFPENKSNHNKSLHQSKGQETRKFALNFEKLSKQSKKSQTASLNNSKMNSKNSKNESFKFDFNENVNSSTTDCPGSESNHNTISEKGKKLTKAVAMDCEMVGIGPSGVDSIIARVSIVNSYGDCLYDEYVKPKLKVTDFRTKVSGVRPSDLKKGKDLFEVQKDVLSIIEGRILVGHSIKHDLDVLFLSHPRDLIRDTAYYKPFRDLVGGRTPSLKKLTSRILGCEIQSGEHSSVEDAQAAMLLYLRQRHEWEALVKSRRRRKPRVIENHK